MLYISILRPIYVMCSSASMSWEQVIWKRKWWIIRAVSWRQTLGGGGGCSLWVGYILDQDIGSRDAWVVQEGDLMRKHCSTYGGGWTFLSVHSEPGGFFRKENSCKQVTRGCVIIIYSFLKLRVHSFWQFFYLHMDRVMCVPHHEISLSLKISVFLFTWRHFLYRGSHLRVCLVLSLWCLK